VKSTHCFRQGRPGRAEGDDSEIREQLLLPFSRCHWRDVAWNDNKKTTTENFENAIHDQECYASNFFGENYVFGATNIFWTACTVQTLVFRIANHKCFGCIGLTRLEGTFSLQFAFAFFFAIVFAFVCMHSKERAG